MEIDCHALLSTYSDNLFADSHVCMRVREEEREGEGGVDCARRSKVSGSGLGGKVKGSFRGEWLVLILGDRDRCGAGLGWKFKKGVKAAK